MPKLTKKEFAAFLEQLSQWVTTELSTTITIHFYNDRPSVIVLPNEMEIDHLQTYILEQTGHYLYEWEIAGYCACMWESDVVTCVKCGKIMVTHSLANVYRALEKTTCENCRETE